MTIPIANSYRYLTGLLLLLFLCLVLMTACSDRAPAKITSDVNVSDRYRDYIPSSDCDSQAYELENTFYVCGEITEDLAREFLNLGPHIHTVIISSIGGDAQAAHSMADFARQRNLKLVFTSYCLSACVQYLFLSDNDVEILPNTLFAVHYSGASYATKLQKRGVLKTERDKLLAQSVFDADKDFYKRHNIPESLLFAGEWLTEPVCVSRTNFIDRNGKIINPFESRFDFWVVDQKFVSFAKPHMTDAGQRLLSMKDLSLLDPIRSDLSKIRFSNTTFTAPPPEFEMDLRNLPFC